MLAWFPSKSFSPTIYPFSLQQYGTLEWRPYPTFFCVESLSKHRQRRNYITAITEHCMFYQNILNLGVFAKVEGQGFRYCLIDKSTNINCDKYCLLAVFPLDTYIIILTSRVTHNTTSSIV